jgi:NADH-quinone oxidoreductase subunit K
MIHPTLAHYLVVGALLFGLGLFTAATRRDAVGMLLGVELVLNAAALNFVAFDHFVAEGKANGSGQVFALLIVAFAASEAAIALAIVLQVHKTHSLGGHAGDGASGAVDELAELRH